MRRSLRSLRPLLAALLLPLASAFQHAPDADPVLLQAAARIVRAQPAVDVLWPGFWPAGRAFLLVRDSGGALLHTTRRPPGTYRRLADAALPAELRGRTWAHDGFPEGLGVNSFHTRYTVGADSGVPALPLKGATALDSMEFFYHEAFHGHQHGAGGFVAVAEEPSSRFGERLVDSAHVAGDGFRRLGEEERRLLAQSLDVTDHDRLRDLLRRYLAVRHERVRHADVWAAERRMERWEGSAQWVGCHAAAAAIGAPTARAVACIRTELERPLDDFPPMPEADARPMRWRQYGTGAALVTALERLGVAWRAPLAAGVPLDRQVADAVGFTAPGS